MDKIEKFYQHENQRNAKRNEEMEPMCPKVSFIIVNKRTSARFMTVDNRGNYDNPKPGTVVSDVITMPER